MPIYFPSVLMVVVGLIFAGVLLVFLLSALGVPVGVKGVPPSPATIIVGLVYLALIFFGAPPPLFAQRAEDRGPIGILVKLAADVGLLVATVRLSPILASAIILLIAIGSAAGVVAGLVLGAIEPMSAAALVLALVNQS
jgi:hypothetical protein